MVTASAHEPAELNRWPLDASAKLLRAVDAVREGLVLLDEHAVVRWCNASSAAMFGLAAEEVPGRPIRSLIRQEIRDLPEDGARRLCTGVRPGGFEITLEVSCPPGARLPGGEPGALVVRDLSQLSATELQLETFFTLSQDLICIADKESRFCRVNPAFTAALGWTELELCTPRFMDFVHPDDVAATNEAMQRLVTGKELGPFENRYRCKDGSYRWISWRAYPIDEHGLIFAIARDVTEQRQQAARLENSERFLRAIIDNAPSVGIQGYDASGRVLFWNPASERIFGWSAAEAVGHTLDELILSREQSAEFAALLAEVARTGLPHGPAEWEFRSREGEPRWVYSSIFAVPSAAGSAPIVCMDVDVTDRVLAEQRRRQFEEQLRHTQKLESLGVLAGGIAHDFNNLLVGILGNAGLAAAQIGDPVSQRVTLGRIEQAAQRAADLTRQMLAYSGHGRFVLEQVDVSEVVREMTELLGASITKRAVVHFDLSENLPTVWVDAAQLRQVVMNLITNASDALSDGPGDVVLRTGVTDVDERTLRDTYVPSDAPPGRYVFIEVTDSGVGMSPQTLARIFDPFFTTKFTGRGLGLAAVLGIVRGNAGAIKVQSKPNEGSTFRVLLPAHPSANRLPSQGSASSNILAAHDSAARGPATAAAPPPSSNAAEQVAPSPPSKPRTVLIVDDMQLVRQTSRAALEADGWSAVEAANGEEALSAIAGGLHVDAIVLDLTMPGLSGVEVLARIRAVHPRIPVLLVSGFADQDSAHPTNDPALRFLQKPFSARALAATLAQLIHDAQTA